MTEQHTPGPWLYSGDEDGDFIVWKSDSDDDFLCNIGGHLASVGVVNGNTIAFDINREEQANARLIATAPELLEALDNLVSMKGSAGRGIFGPEIWDAANAAINKAKGVN